MLIRKPIRAICAALLACAIALSLVPTHVQAASSGEIKKQINALKEEKKQLQAQIKEIKNQYQANENEMLDMVSQKNTIDQEITLLNDEVDNINEQIATYSLLIADKQDELEDAQSRLDVLNEKNKARIRVMEEEGNLSYWEVIFKANSFSDLLDRLNMVQEIAAADKRRIQEMTQVAEEVRVAQAALEEEKAEVEEVLLELADAQAVLDEKRLEADELLRQLIEKGDEYELLLEQSELAQDELMQEIAQKEKEYKDAQYKEWLATYVPPTTRPAQQTPTPSIQVPSSGGWVCPVSGYTISSPFGMRVHPILGYARMHSGIDMSCPSGTPIYAAKSGKVTRAAWGNDAGNYVSINHGDGFASIYMHMTNYIVSTGSYVTAGQVIGYVGSTGISTGPHLHFGISYNGTYVNPLPYIS